MPKLNGRKRELKRAPTTYDVARSLGVSQSTVSRAFSSTASVSEETRSLIINAAQAIGYRPNAIARSLITRRTDIVAIVMENLSDPYHAAVLSLLSQRIQAEGRHVLLFMIPEGSAADDVLPDALAYKADAIIITSATATSKAARMCAALEVPLVLFNRYVPGLKVSAFLATIRARAAKSRNFSPRAPTCGRLLLRAARERQRVCTGKGDLPRR